MPQLTSVELAAIIDRQRLIANQPGRDPHGEVVRAVFRVALDAAKDMGMGLESRHTFMVACGFPSWDGPDGPVYRNV